MNKKFFIVGVPSLIGGAVTWSLWLLPNSNNQFLESSILENTYNPVFLNGQGSNFLKSSGKGFLNHVENYGKALNNDQYLYGGDIDEATGGKRIDIIEARSLKLGTTCGAYGTGWFLDYEIPDDGKYPTKWFIATNAHVVNSYKFKDDRYNQKLPLTSYSRRQCTVRGEENYTNLLLSKESKKNNKNGFDKSRSPEEWLNLSSIIKSFSEINAKDASLTNADTSDESIFYYLKISDPKLFYVPINFLGDQWMIDVDGVKKNYYRDFAVLEVDFPNEKAAKLITDDFYNKIKDGRIEELNFFAEELLANKTSDELESDNESYFVAGYPSNSNNQFQISGNYYYSRKRASKISFVPWYLDYAAVKNIHGEKIVGHIDLKKFIGRVDIVTDWNGGGLYEWGYDYLIDSFPGGKGNSGALVANSKGDVLGLVSLNLGEVGGVVPLRSKGFYDGTQLIYPPYDLILGMPGQIGSYKYQLDTYHPNLKTYLRNKWTNRT